MWISPGIPLRIWVEKKKGRYDRRLKDIRWGTFKFSDWEKMTSLSFLKFRKNKEDSGKGPDARIRSVSSSGLITNLQCNLGLDPQPLQVLVTWRCSYQPCFLHDFGEKSICNKACKNTLKLIGYVSYKISIKQSFWKMVSLCPNCLPLWLVLWKFSLPLYEGWVCLSEKCLLNWIELIRH